MNSKCNTCKGTGKLHISPIILSGSSTTQGETVTINCIWCKGTGELTPEQLQERENFENAWCKCGNPSGQVTSHGDGDFYTCDDCSKIVQIG